MDLQLIAAALAASLSVAPPPVTGRPVPLSSLSAHGFVHGSGWVLCAAGRISGSVPLSGEAPATGPRGEMGTIPLSGTATLSGSCADGAGTAQGLARVRGGGSLVAPDGSHGRAELSGAAIVSVFVGESYVFINEPVTLAGTFVED